MIAPLIDIPAGLESAYQAVVSFLGGNNPNTIITTRPSPAKKNYSVLGSRSLFVQFRDTYNALSGARHIAWRSYWISLPFGSHAGAGGYPGSGFSAFVYVNAPRYQAGLDLLLDPPAIGNLLVNPSFVGSVSPWELGTGWSYVSGLVRILAGDYSGYLSYVRQNVPAIEDTLSYHIKIVFRAPADNFENDGPASVFFSFGVGADSHLVPQADLSSLCTGNVEVYETDMTAETASEGPDNRPFNVFAGILDILDGEYFELFSVELTPN